MTSKQVINDYEKRLQELQTEIGHCVCGQPAESLLFIYDVLKDIQTQKSYEEHREYRQKLFHNDPAIEATIYYMFDKYGWIEHGGSLPGWLDTKGEELLEKLEVILPELEKDCEI